MKDHMMVRMFEGWTRDTLLRPAERERGEVRDCEARCWLLNGRIVFSLAGGRLPP